MYMFIYIYIVCIYIYIYTYTHIYIYIYISNPTRSTQGRDLCRCYSAEVKEPFGRHIAAR